MSKKRLGHMRRPSKNVTTENLRHHHTTLTHSNTPGRTTPTYTWETLQDTHRSTLTRHTKKGRHQNNYKHPGNTNIHTHTSTILPGALRNTPLSIPKHEKHVWSTYLSSWMKCCTLFMLSCTWRMPSLKRWLRRWAYREAPPSLMYPSRSEELPDLYPTFLNTSPSDM